MPFVTTDQAEVAFQRYLASKENYTQAIYAAGDLPWYEHPERSAALAAQLGLPADTPPMELRRALFHRGKSKGR